MRRPWRPTKPARILREQDAVTDGEPSTQGGGEGDRGKAQGKRSLAARRLLGEAVERAFDRAAQLLQGRAPIRTGPQAGIDRLAELARQVGARPAQGPHE